MMAKEGDVLEVRFFQGSSRTDFVPVIATREDYIICGGNHLVGENVLVVDGLIISHKERRLYQTS
jgi:hypothetical protein